MYRYIFMALLILFTTVTCVLPGCHADVQIFWMGCNGLCWSESLIFYMLIYWQWENSFLHLWLLYQSAGFLGYAKLNLFIVRCQCVKDVLESGILGTIANRVSKWLEQAQKNIKEITDHSLTWALWCLKG
jgi:hypothetical protein